LIQARYLPTVGAGSAGVDVAGRARRVVAAVGACGLALGAAGCGAQLHGTADLMVTLGDRETLLGDGNALGLAYFPDEGTSLVSGNPFRLAIADGLTRASFVVEAAGTGSDPVQALGHATEIFGPGAPTDFDNGYAGISAVYRHSNGVSYGFYHAEDQVGTGTIPGTTIPGFYARIGIAYSTDGLTWTKGGYVIESFVPKRASDGVTVQYDQGAAEPGAIASADGKWLYLYYTEHSRVNPAGGSRPVEICMARADLASWPPVFSSPPGAVHAFKKYYQGSFSTDGIGGYDSPVIAPPTASSNSLEGHVAYSATLSKFVMVYGVDAWQERSAAAPVARTSGLYAAFSDDGITWRTQATPLITDFGVPQPGLSLSWEGSILWDEGTDTAGWLVYGYSPSWGQPGHYLVGRRLTLHTR
jgi:hypothetical protein